MRKNLPLLLAGIALGAAIAVVYGWVIRPIEYIDTTPDSLRIDFRTDYVLMVAEAYGGDEDITLARVRLAALGPRPVTDYVAEAIDYAEANEFDQVNRRRLDDLADRLSRSRSP